MKSDYPIWFFRWCDWIMLIAEEAEMMSKNHAKMKYTRQNLSKMLRMTRKKDWCVYGNIRDCKARVTEKKEGF